MDSEFEKTLIEMKKDKKFSPENLKLLFQIFEDRLWRALLNLIESSVKKYVFSPSNRIAWIVIGRSKDYLIKPKLYCPCEDFYLNVVVRKNAKMCYHLLSQVLAENLEYYEKITVEDARYDELLNDWKQS